MTVIHYQDNDTTQYTGDCRDMSELPDRSVQMVCTSPPYWMLRQYDGVPDLVWGGDPDCKHNWLTETVYQEMRKGLGLAELGKKYRGGGHKIGKVGTLEIHRGTCTHCGAWKGGWGLEPTPEMYVLHSIEVLREVRRVLRDDGVVYWNIGDNYIRSGGEPGGGNRDLLHMEGIQHRMTRIPVGSGLKPKDLALIPARIQIAAQADGWYVRSVIIWEKNNPMPESVLDRPTTSHEYVLMLTKSARYYYDSEAVREPYNPASLKRYEYALQDTCNTYGQHQPGFQEKEITTKVRPPNPAGRNLRSVWTIATQPSSIAHYASFPDAIPERCILAATPEAGCCSNCGAPLKRILEGGFTEHDGETDTEYDEGSTAGRLAKLRQAARANGGEYVNTKRTVGWEVTCDCQMHDPALPVIDGVVPMVPYPVVPSTVLDICSGKGTTLKVAKRLGRRSIGWELSPKYCEMAVETLRQQMLL